VWARGPREADATVPSGLRYRLIGGPSLGKTAKNGGRASARVVLSGGEAVSGLGTTPGRPRSWVAAMKMLIHQPRDVYVKSAEDTVLRKLLSFRLGGGASDRPLGQAPGLPDSHESPEKFIRLHRERLPTTRNSLGLAAQKDGGSRIP